MHSAHLILSCDMYDTYGRVLSVGNAAVISNTGRMDVVKDRHGGKMYCRRTEKVRTHNGHTSTPSDASSQVFVTGIYKSR